MSKIMTCDQEWSHEELYGVAYDECMRACQGLTYLLDNPDLKKPNILMDNIMDMLGDHNLVDKYDALYTSKDANDTSDDVFNRWDSWMQNTIKETLQAHRYKHYNGGI